MDLKLDPHSQYKFLQNERNLGGKKMYGDNPSEEFKVNILPDKSVTPGNFAPNKTMPGTYRAHPTTIEALRKDIFAGIHNDTFEELEYLYKCEGCKAEIDLQFWHFCPYCEKQFPKNLPKPIKRDC